MDKDNKELYHWLYIISIKIYKSYFLKWVAEHCKGVYRELDHLNLHWLLTRFLKWTKHVGAQQLEAVRLSWALDSYQDINSTH